MNRVDISNALQFLNINDTLLLLVTRYDNIPLTKRALIKILGEPRKMIGNSLYYYNNKRIDIIPVVRNGHYNHQDLTGVRTDPMFYIRWTGGADEEVLLSAGIEVDDTPIRSIRLWQSLGMSASSMYRALQVDGYDSIQATEILTKCGIVSY